MWYGSLKEGNGYHNTCQSSSLCKVRLLTECQWPYVLASLACQWSGCWLAGWTLGCDAGCSGASSRQCCVTTGVAWSETLRAGHWPLGPHKTWVWPNISAVLWWITNLPAKLLCQMNMFPEFHTASLCSPQIEHCVGKLYTPCYSLKSQGRKL